MVREAMVKIMLGSRLHQRKREFRAGRSSFAEGQERDVVREIETGGAGQALAYRQQAGDASTCIFWCTIALGALVQGCPLEFVSCRRLNTRPDSHHCRLHSLLRQCELLSGARRLMH